MRFLADECLARSLADAARSAGHDVLIIDGKFSGKDDSDVLSRAAQDGRVVLTEDRGFGELIVRLQLPALGVVVVELDRLTPDVRTTRLLAAIASAGNSLVGHISVVEPHRTRQRPFARTV
jgi:predicted nuclease of predicted toxin-antitoxin system